MSGPASPSIVTPEAVVLDVERAGVASRTLAAVIDLVALGLVWLVLFLAVVAVADQLGGVGSAIVYVLASVLLVVAWFAGFESLMEGRTPGKAALGLRVVSADGTPVRFQQTLLRAAMGFVDFLLIPFGVVAIVGVLLSRRDQRLGDMAAGTFVVRERSVGHGVAPVWFAPPWGLEAYAQSLDVRALDADAYGLIRSYLLRVPELRQAARDHLAARLAGPVAARMGHRVPRSVHPHAFLMCVAAMWQHTHAPAPPPQYPHAAAPTPPPPPPPPPPPHGAAAPPPSPAYGPSRGAPPPRAPGTPPPVPRQPPTTPPSPPPPPPGGRGP
ncbi:MAG TPA: RDD family protein [Acidimicrobiales bacterium]